MSNVKKINFLFKLFAFFKVPMIFYCGVKVIELDDKKAIVKIPLKRRTKNHLNSMYFGALAVGADVAGGILAFSLIQKRKLKISLVFKDLKADFLKRHESDVVFCFRRRR
jgi:acyl-coenzyme A thioesterase PaaI-like protein